MHDYRCSGPPSTKKCHALVMFVEQGSPRRFREAGASRRTKTVLILSNLVTLRLSHEETRSRGHEDTRTFLSMGWSSLRHRQINEKMARVVDQFEICVTMSWFGMVANGTPLNRSAKMSVGMSADIPTNSSDASNFILGASRRHWTTYEAVYKTIYRI
jgi:hypothetical protein